MLISATTVLLVALIALASTRSGVGHRLDVAFDDTLNRYVAGHPAQVTAWKVLTDIGGPSTWRVLAAVAGIALWLVRRRRDAVVVATTMVAAAAGSSALKVLVGRHRPTVPSPVDHALGGSFPSGHALTSFTALGLLVLLTWPRLTGWTRSITVVAAIVLVVAVGFSRLILGVHYLTDVLGGWLLGLLVLAAASAIPQSAFPAPSRVTR